MSSHRIELGLKKGFFDAIGSSVKKDIEEDLLIKSITKVSYVDVFYFNANISINELKNLVEAIFLDEVINVYSINENLFDDFDYSITVKYHQGITDNLAIVAETAIKDFGIQLKENESIKTARKYYFKGKLSVKQLKTIAEKLLANTLIESFEIEVLK